MGTGRQFSKFRSRLIAFGEIERQIRRGIPCTSASLARDLGVDRRTIRRYIEFMRDGLGAPIEYDPIDQRYVFTSPAWSMPNVHLSDDELTSLAVGTRALVALMPAPFSESLNQLFSKLLDALPDQDQQEILDLQERIEIIPSPVRSKGSEWTNAFIKAIREKYSVEMSYYALSKKRLSKRSIDPYHLRFVAGTWYVVGYDHQTKHFPVFNLARVKGLETSSLSSFRLRKFSASAYFQNTFGITVGGSPRPIRIRISGRAAETADERIWPDGFRYKDAGDGTGLLEGVIGKLDDVLAWIASTDGDALII